MTTADAYRQIANQQRSLASNQKLPRVREQLSAAADRWEWLAEEFEATQSGLSAMFEGVRRAAH
jgi:hypothetical protein